MSFTRSIFAAVAASVALAGPAAAQDHAVWFLGKSGGFNAATNLNAAGTADFNKIGYNVGGAVGVQVNPYVTLRGNFSFARNQMQANGLDTGDRLNRFFYDAAIQLQYPTTVGLEPYVFAGGGAVTLHEVGTSGQDKTKGTGTFGLGLNYTIPQTGLGLFVEGQGWVYQMSKLDGYLSSYDKTQVEIGWSGGLSYRLPF